MNATTRPPAIIAPTVSGRGQPVGSAGRGCSDDARSGGTEGAGFAILVGVGRGSRGTGGAGARLIGAATGGSTGFPRALQKSSRFFRLVATNG